MTSDARGHVLRQLGFVVATWREDPRSDIELLTRFVQTRDEQAFSSLVGRYSQLVWGTCRRILANRADAEDALQATFLRLARDARMIVNREALAGWLFRAARACAIDLRRMIERQRRIEERLTAVVERAGETTSQTNLRLLLDDELAQLSERDRAVLILCCLEGRTYAEVGIELGCSIAAVHRRLVRAQTHLRRRLARHGPAAVAAFVGGSTLLIARDSSAASPAVLAQTTQKGVSFARMGVLPTGRSASLVGTTSTQSHVMIVPMAIAVLLVGGLLVGSLGNGGSVEVPTQSNRIDSPAPNDPDSRAVVSGVIRDPNGALLPGAEVAAMARRPFGPGEPRLRDELLGVATADAEGRFRLKLPADFETWFTERVITVQASAPGFAPATRPVRVQVGLPIELQLGASVPLRGRLLDPAGQPAAGVRVEVVRIGDVVAEPIVGGAHDRLLPRWPEPVVTGDDGTFSFPAIGGSVNVWIRVIDPGYALDTYRADRPGGSADFRLDEARTLSVEVREVDTDRLLPGARITVITDRLKAHPHFCVTEHGIVGPHTVPADIDAVADACGTLRLSVARGDRVELLVHAPEAAGPYVGLRTQIEIGDEAKGRSLVVRLPRGQWVTGVVTDRATGKPLVGAAVHWGRDTATKPEWRDDVLLGRDAIARTGPEGEFRLAVSPGACSIRVHGPTLDYPPVPARVGGTASTNLFAHSVTRIDVPERGEIPSLRVALDTGRSVAGVVDHPFGGREATLFFMCSGRVSPVRPYAGLTLPVRGNAFVVPGCRDGYSTRAYFLDPVTGVGAVIDLTPDGPTPKAKLEPCGRIRVRVIGSNGEPRVGQDVSVSLLLDRDWPNGIATVERPSEPQPAEWFDPVNYLTRPKTNADGVVELPALIPAHRYAVSVGSGAAKVTLGPVLIQSGKTITLPDAVLPSATASRPEPGGTR